MLIHQFPSQQVISSLKNKVDSNSQGNVEWPSVIVAAKEKTYSKYSAETAFSIITNRQGTASFSVQNKSLRVCDETFFIFNPYQSFEYEIKSETEVETYNIHYNYSSYLEALRSLLYSDELLLIYPEDQADYLYHFHNQLHYKNPHVARFLEKYTEEDKDTYFLELLQYLLKQDKKDKSKSNNISTAKKATQEELFSRILTAKDLIYSYYNVPELSVDFLSKEVAMSKYHFLRVFKSVYKCSPYQFLSRVRLEKVKSLIEKTDLPVYQIALDAGFQEPNSVYPFIKKHLSISPLNYRKAELAILNSDSGAK